MPANAGQVFQTLTKIAAFDVFEIGDYVDELLDLDPENDAADPVNTDYESLGFETKWFIHNIGSFFIYQLFCFVCVILFLFVAALNMTTGYAHKFR